MLRTALPWRCAARNETGSGPESPRSRDVQASLAGGDQRHRPASRKEPGTRVWHGLPATPGGVSTADRRGDERRSLQPLQGGELHFDRYGNIPCDLAEAMLDESKNIVLGGRPEGLHLVGGYRPQRSAFISEIHPRWMGTMAVGVSTMRHGSVNTVSRQQTGIVRRKSP